MTSSKESRHDAAHPETFSMSDWSLVTDSLPPRDPNDNDDDDDDEPDDEREPAVIREPDEDE
jgi:hypothetical protein